MKSEVAELAAQVRGHLARLRERGTLRVPAAEPGSGIREPEAGSREPQVGSREPDAGVGAGVGVGGADGLTLPMIRQEIGDCTRCKLHKGRTNIVFGVGNPNADLVFVGEAPGFHEDQKGEPFVGDAGQLLDKMIEAMGWRRSEVYIANILKCRPPNNRNPEPDEVEQCEPFLIKQLGAIRPRLIVALGKFAAQSLLRQPNTPISALRGKFHQYQGVKVMPTYHPAFLLRQPGMKRVVWEDLQLVMVELERLGIQAPNPKKR